MKIFFFVLNLLFAYLLYFIESFIIIFVITGSGSALNDFNAKYGSLPNYLYVIVGLLHISLFYYFFRSAKNIKIAAVTALVFVYSYRIIASFL